MFEFNINLIEFLCLVKRELSESKLKELGVQMLDGYKDPYGGRSLTLGEIGCFLSHYVIWKDVSSLICINIELSSFPS